MTASSVTELRRGPPAPLAVSGSPDPRKRLLVPDPPLTLRQQHKTIKFQTHLLQSFTDWGVRGM